jgi:hypothetical protein
VGCPAPLVPALTPWGLVLLVGFMSIAAVWMVRVREQDVALWVGRSGDR